MNTDTRTHRASPVDGTPAAAGTAWRTRLSLAAAAAAVVVVGLIAVNVVGDDSGGDGPLAQGPPLVLSLGESDALASCMALDTGLLAGMSPAFAATATAVGDGVVTLDVDRWYTGGDAATVELEAQPGMEALIAGFDFEVGRQYLITASDGTVNFCGYSGPATPELTALFDQAFAG